MRANDRRFHVTFKSGEKREIRAGHVQVGEHGSLIFSKVEAGSGGGVFAPPAPPHVQPLEYFAHGHWKECKEVFP